MHLNISDQPVPTDTTASVYSTETEKPLRVRPRLEFLDVVRAVAALAVIVEHSCERFFPSYLVWANKHFTFGVFGVASFFLVSGFIIPASMDRHKSLTKFWIARAFRLYPLYWASILLVCIVAGSAGFPPMFHTQPVRLLLTNVLMVQFFFDTPNIIGVSWTLSMELVFYLLCSVLYIIGGVSRSLLWAWVAVLGNLALSVILGVFLHKSIPAGRTALLVIAFSASLVYRAFNKQISFVVVCRLLPVLALSLLTGFWFRFAVYPTNDRNDRFTFIGTAASYLGAYALFFGLYLLRHHSFPKILLWLGRISYSMYLLHGFILFVIPLGPLPWLRLAAVIVLVIGLSSLTFVLIEQPPLVLHRKMELSRKAA